MEALGGGTAAPAQEMRPARNGLEGSVPRPWENPVLRDLGGAVVDTGLARTITEAYTLIIPAFYHYNLLPEVPK